VTGVQTCALPICNSSSNSSTSGGVSVVVPGTVHVESVVLSAASSGSLVPLPECGGGVSLVGTLQVSLDGSALCYCSEQGEWVVLGSPSSGGSVCL